MGRATPLRIEQDELSSGIEGIFSGTPANADVASEGVRTHTRLRLATRGDADERTRKPQTPETRPERQKFHIVGIDRVPMRDGLWTIVRGIVNGKPQAVVLDAEHPPEFMLPTKPASESTGFLHRLSRSFLGRALFALGGVVAAAACTPPSGNSPGDGGIANGVYGTDQAALTEADVDNLGPPTLIQGSTFGDQWPNIAQIDGQTVLTFSREDGEMWYVDCEEFADCLATGIGAPDLIGGIPPVPVGNIYRGAIYQDAGGDKIAYGFGGTVGWRAISYGAGGTLEAPVFGGALAPAMSADHIGHREADGVSHLIYDAGVVVNRNMATGVNTGTGIPGSPDANLCGVPHQDGDGVAINSKYIDLGGGVYRCQLVQAATLADLNASLNFIQSQNVGPGGVLYDRLVNTRVFGNYLVYVRYDENPPGSGIWEPRMYYAVVQEYCGNGVCAPGDGEDSVSCPADCPPLGDDDSGPDDDDSGSGDDDSGGPGDDDSGGDDDAGDDDVGDDDVGDDDAGDDDAGDDDAGDDDAGDDDAGDDDVVDDDDSSTTPGACDFAEDRITMTKGECNLDECEDPFVDVVGACTFEVDLGNENPVTLEIDGRYGLDFLNDAGELLAGSYRVIDRGNGMDTVTGDLVTGVVGTIYGGDLNQAGDTYHVYCEEGVITILYNDKIIATLEAGQKQTFNLDDPVPGDDDDTQDDDDTTPDGGDDDVSDDDDTTQPPPGCSCEIKGGPENASHAKIAGMLILGAVALMRRKREKKALFPKPVGDE